MSTHLRSYDISLAANGGAIEDVVGTSLLISDAFGPFRIRSADGLQLDLLPGQGWENFPFRRLEFVDLSQAANRVRLVAGGDPDKPLIQPLRMIDRRAFTRTQDQDLGRASKTMIGFAAVPASVGNYGHVELYNNSPATNEVQLALYRLTFTAAAAMNWSISYQAGALPSVAMSGKPKLINSPVTGQGQVRYQSNVVSPVSVLYAIQATRWGQTVDFVFDQPIIVPRTFSLRAGPDVANTAFSMSAEWVEL